ncbi:hypothetical protein MUN88_14225 [Gracilibacillus caseinilyticus]|uniref:TrbL/VirB6 plasmid conjugal transfer protein n=1 Tax=Gracilibacillus caseinilyticus TaxID=2932256 RepID=A0ABY4ESK1_9BACI|nr:hypothetical protein [Gracilibacillus caseinilyticus]UOQ47224.1 hypothetical protein MUN88_14225 [Gracilibacillus caseinilyticus]
MGIIGDALSWIGNLIWNAIQWLLGGIGDFFQTLIDIIVGFFQVIFEVIEGLLYLLYMIGVLAVKLFQVILESAGLLWALVKGFSNTLTSLSYAPKSSGGHGYSEMIGRIFDALEPMQLEPIAYVLLFVLWFTTAIAAMKLISSIRVGGD